MNREIKFKVFFYDGIDYSTGEMVDFEYAINEDFISSDGKTLKPNDECSIILQYTGLKDKNGKEIYEGDIVKGTTGNTFASHKIKNYKVIWGVDSWHIEKTFFSLQELFNYCNNNIEVIGNIYENANLIQ